MRFIESIQFKDGSYVNLSLHQDRIDRVFQQYASNNSSHQLTQLLPDLDMEGTYKVRMVYDLGEGDAAFDLEYAQYHPRKIETLEVVNTEPFDYSMKFEDRSKINSLVNKSAADDIIVAIDNHLTDGSYFNLAFWDGKHWFTPSSPLLKGVRRTQLLGEGLIREREICIDDLPSFKKVSLINAMLDLGQLEVPINQIKL